MSKLITWRYGLLLITLIAVSVLAGRWVWAQESSVVLIAAGDIADCDSTGDEATAELVDQIPGTIATLGDNVYPVGHAKRFAECYTSSWGRFKDRTRPAAGNHEYEVPGAAGYFTYFGSA